MSKTSLEDEDSRQQILVALRKLTYREREIIKLRYGIGDGYTYTLEEVGKIFKVTRGRIHAIEQKALEKLRRLGIDFYE